VAGDHKKNKILSSKLVAQRGTKN